MKDSEILLLVRASLAGETVLPHDVTYWLLNLLQHAALTLEPERFAVWHDKISKLLAWVDSMLEGQSSLFDYLKYKGMSPSALAHKQYMSIDGYMHQLEIKWLDWMIFTCKEENN